VARSVCLGEGGADSAPYLCRLFSTAIDTTVDDCCPERHQTYYGFLSEREGHGIEQGHIRESPALTVDG